MGVDVGTHCAVEHSSQKSGIARDNADKTYVTIEEHSIHIVLLGPAETSSCNKVGETERDTIPMIEGGRMCSVTQKTVAHSSRSALGSTTNVNCTMFLCPPAKSPLHYN